MDNIFDHGVFELIKDNFLNIHDKKVLMSTIAEPTLITSCGDEFEIRVGSEIPFQLQTQNQITTTEWKFAGLSLKGTLKKTKIKT